MALKHIGFQRTAEELKKVVGCTATLSDPWPNIEDVSMRTPCHNAFMSTRPVYL